MNILNKTLKILQSFFLGIFMISFAIAFVILFRPYYYLNISILNLEQETGYSYEVIKDAFDDVMDFLVLNEEFGTGELKYSEDGKSHFEDCKKLFTFDFVCLYISSLFLIVIFVLKKTKIIQLEYKKFSPGIYAIIWVGAAFLVLGIWGIIDFDSLFTAFHKVCFPGKDNWMFSPYQDQIINILPTQLWMNYCILIVFILLLFIASFIIIEVYRKKELKKAKEV